eukprot:6097086-Pyramimonas_sp.AAC.1
MSQAKAPVWDSSADPPDPPDPPDPSGNGAGGRSGPLPPRAGGEDDGSSAETPSNYTGSIHTPRPESRPRG